MAYEPYRTEYVCPACGDKILYVEEMGRIVDNELPAARKLAGIIRRWIDINLDETEFCKSCRGAGCENSPPRLAIVIRYCPENETRRFPGAGLDDLFLLRDFLEGRDRHASGNGGESQLVDFLPRLKELFGVDIHD